MSGIAAQLYETIDFRSRVASCLPCRDSEPGNRPQLPLRESLFGPIFREKKTKQNKKQLEASVKSGHANETDAECLFADEFSREAAPCKRF